MDYIRECIAFREWALVNHPNTGEVALWHALLDINNMAAWVDWFPAPVHTLAAITGLSRQGIDRCRNQLIQKGLIEYRKGSGRSSGTYQLISFECKKIGTTCDTTRTQSDTQRGHNADMNAESSFECKIIGTTCDTTRAQSDTQRGHNADMNAEPIFECKKIGTARAQNDTQRGRKVNIKRISSMSVLKRKVLKDLKDLPAACSNTRVTHVHEDHDTSRLLVIGYEDAFGQAINPVQLNQLMAFIKLDHFATDLVIFGLRQAALQGKDWSYSLGILRSWRQKGIRTIEEAKSESEAFKAQRRQDHATNGVGQQRSQGAGSQVSAIGRGSTTATSNAAAADWFRRQMAAKAGL